MKLINAFLNYVAAGFFPAADAHMVEAAYDVEA